MEKKKNAIKSVHSVSLQHRMLFAKTNIIPLPILSADVGPRTIAYWGPEASQAGTVEEEECVTQWRIYIQNLKD